MRLANGFLPTYEFSETHSMEIKAALADVMAAVEAFRPEDDRFFRWAIALRELPMRLTHGAQVRSPAAFGMDNFTLLGRTEDELVYALAGKLWQLDFGQAKLQGPEAFQAFREPGSVKLVIGFHCQVVSPLVTTLMTETRVQCLDESAFARFRPYWYLIRPVSGWIRRRMLKTIARTCRGHGH